MHVRFILTIIAFLYATSTVLSQTDSLKLAYEKEVIYLSGRYYIKNNQKYTIKNLSSEFQNSPEGLSEFRAHQSDARKARNYFLIGALTYFAGVFVLSENANAATGIMASSFVPYIIGIHFSKKANKKSKKALWLRNRDALFK